MRLKKVVFTDLDGTLLDLFDYSYAPAIPMLAALKNASIPVVFCTAKTFAENEYYRKEMGIGDPFIVENGGAIFIPKNYFSFLSKATDRGDYYVIELGVSYEKIRNVLMEIRKETGFKIKGFGDMTVLEIARDANLSVEMAELAKKKEYNESFIFDEPKEKENILFEKIREKGFNIIHGGRYYNIHGKDTDKGKAVKVLTKLFKKEYGEVMTIGIGDSANDIPMLKAVDKRAVVKNKKGGWLDISDAYKAKDEGPRGWAEFVELVVVSSE